MTIDFTTAVPVQESFAGWPPHGMYVQTWGPTSGTAGQRTPLILIHGGAHTGVCWTATPDGRAGWARHFAARGWITHIVDWPGVGRSGWAPDFLTMGPGPVLDALQDLLRRTGPAILIGHSIGAALAFKLTDLAPDLVRAIVALTPGPIGNVPVGLPLRPLDVPARYDRDAALRFFANADRFPKEAFDDYFASLVPMSPSIENALGDRGDPSLRVEQPEVVRRRPILFIAGDQDQLAVAAMTLPMAELFGVRHIQPGADWGLHGFGHMIPIEQGSEAIAERVLDWLNAEAPRLARQAS